MGKNITIEEKAQQIIGCKRNCLECGGRNSVEKGCVEFRRIIAMAKWKDKQFNELINALPTPIKELIKAYANNQK